MAAEVLSFIRSSVFAEEIAERPGFLQGLDPRAKVAAFAFGIGAVLFARRLEVLAVLYVAVVVLAVASKIPLGFFIKRVWVFIPIFAGIIVLPVLFGPVSHGQPLIVLWRWHDGTPFAITDNGLWTAGMLVLRVATSVSLTVLTVLTTRRAHLLRALRVLAVPRVFVLTLEMTYRYIFLLIGIIEAEHLAKESRTIRPASLNVERQWAASRMGRLFLRSRQMGEEVFLAMLARGYSGEAKLFSPFRLRVVDVLGICSGLIVLAAVIWLNHRT